MLKNISEIIPFLEKSLNAKILDYTASPLTALGDNFGSTILAINVKVKFSIRDDDILNEVWHFVLLNGIFFPRQHSDVSKIRCYIYIHRCKQLNWQ